MLIVFYTPKNVCKEKYQEIFNKVPNINCGHKDIEEKGGPGHSQYSTSTEDNNLDYMKEMAEVADMAIVFDSN